MMTTRCLIFWMPEALLEADAEPGIPTPAETAATASTPARLASRFGTTTRILSGDVLRSSAARQRRAKSDLTDFSSLERVHGPAPRVAHIDIENAPRTARRRARRQPSSPSVPATCRAPFCA